MQEKFFLKADEVATALGLGRTKVYELIREGQIKSVLIGGRNRRVSQDALRDYIDSVVSKSPDQAK